MDRSRPRYLRSRVAPLAGQNRESWTRHDSHRAPAAMRVLCVTPMFPEPGAPNFGSFVQALVVTLRVVSAVEIDLLARRPGWRGVGSYVELLARGLAHGRRGYDLVWAHYLGTGAGVALAVARVARCPLVISVHGSDVEAASRAGATPVLAALARRAAGLHFVSAALAARAGDLLGELSRHTLVQPVGVDRSRFSPSPEPRLPGRRRLLMVASLAPYKGWTEALDAVSQLKDLDVDLIGIGAGDPRWVHAEANRLGVGERFTLRAPRAQHQMPPLYWDADLVVAPSYREGFGLVPLEAMACGIPVVCTGVGGMADYVRDRENALVVRAGDASCLASAIREVLEDGPLRHRLIEGGLATTPRLDIQTAARTLAGFFSRIVASSDFRHEG